MPLKFCFSLAILCLVFTAINTENSKSVQSDHHSQNRNHHEENNSNLQTLSKNRAAGVKSDHHQQQYRENVSKAHSSTRNKHQKSRRKYEHNPLNRLGPLFGSYHIHLGTNRNQLSTNGQNPRTPIHETTDHSESPSQTMPYFPLVFDPIPVATFCVPTLGLTNRGFILLLASNVRGRAFFLMTSLISQHMLNPRLPRRLEDQIVELLESQGFSELSVTPELKRLLKRTHIHAKDLQSMNRGSSCSHRSVMIKVDAFISFIQNISISTALRAVLSVDCLGYDPDQQYAIASKLSIWNTTQAAPMGVTGETLPGQTNESGSEYTISASDTEPSLQEDRQNNQQQTRHGHQQHHNRNNQSQTAERTHKDRSRHDHPNQHYNASSHQYHYDHLPEKLESAARTLHQDRHHVKTNQNRDHGNSHSK